MKAKLNVTLVDSPQLVPIKYLCEAGRYVPSQFSPKTEAKKVKDIKLEGLPVYVRHEGKEVLIGTTTLYKNE